MKLVIERLGIAIHHFLLFSSRLVTVSVSSVVACQTVVGVYAVEGRVKSLLPVLALCLCIEILILTLTNAVALIQARIRVEVIIIIRIGTLKGRILIQFSLDILFQLGKRHLQQFHLQKLLRGKSLLLLLYQSLFLCESVFECHVNLG